MDGFLVVERPEWSREKGRADLQILISTATTGKAVICSCADGFERAKLVNRYTVGIRKHGYKLRTRFDGPAKALTMWAIPMNGNGQHATED